VAAAIAADIVQAAKMRAERSKRSKREFNFKVRNWVEALMGTTWGPYAPLPAAAGGGGGMAHVPRKRAAAGGVGGRPGPFGG
jgi:hypothetical protein